VAPAAGIPAVPAAGTPAGPASPAAIPAATDSGTAGAADGSGDSQAVAGPDGPGWVIEIKGHHFYNEDITTWGGTHVRDTFLKNLREQTVELPTGPGLPPTRFTMAELGIGFVVLTVDPPIDQANRIPNPYYEPTLQAPGSGVPGMPGMMDASGGMMPAMAPAMPAAPGAGPPGSGAKTEKKEKEEPKEPPFFAAPKYTFVLQFCWQERLLTERLRKRQQEQMPQPADQPQPEQPQPGQPQPAVPDNKVAAATTGG
jgi:type IV pilus assembly protein PilM